MPSTQLETRVGAWSTQGALQQAEPQSGGTRQCALTGTQKEKRAQEQERSAQTCYHRQAPPAAGAPPHAVPHAWQATVVQCVLSPRSLDPGHAQS